MSAKGVVSGILTVAVLAGLGGGGWYYYKQHIGTGATRSEKVFVQRVAAVNTVGGADLFTNSYAGVIVAQKTVDVKYDMNKTVEEVLVKDGDTVKKGDKLLTYNVEAIQLQIEEAKLEVERLQNSIEANKNEIAELEQLKRSATGDAEVSYATQILSLQSQNARTEYDIKAKNVELTKLENSLNNAFVTAPIDGTVRDLKEISSSQQNSYSENPDVIMKIAAEGDFRVKGTFNEQNSGQIYQGAPMVLRSRIDDTEWKGTVSEIDTNPQTDNSNMYGYYMSDEQTTSTKYAFYVMPESLEGFMLGQHILIEPDRSGGEEEVQKEGIWLYSSFVLWDGSQNYVWAKTSRDTIEKRVVEVGQVDDNYGDCQILSGLDTEDYIAYPADYIEVGMKTTTNQSDKDIPDNVMGDDMYGGDEMYGDEDMYGDKMEYDDGNVSYDEDGNMTYMDDEGNVYRFDPEGNLIEGGDGEMMPEDGEPMREGGEPGEGDTDEMSGDADMQGADGMPAVDE